MEWPPKNIPKKFPMSPHRDGWVKSINGKTRHVCGKLGFNAARARLKERMENGDFKAKPPPKIEPAHVGGKLLVLRLANVYFEWLRLRVDDQANKFKPLDLRTYEDIRLAIQLFVDTRWKDARGNTFRLAELPAADLGPEHFSAYVAKIPGASPYTKNRYVAYVTTMFRWGEKNDHLPHLPRFGSDFRKATVDELDTARADIKKAFTSAEVRAMLHRTFGPSTPRITAADLVKFRAWVLLGCNAAFTNVDLSKMSKQHYDSAGGVVQLRRGKLGRAFRKAMLHPITVQAVEAYQRPVPADESLADRVFLTDRGLPLVRTKDVRDERGALTKATRVDNVVNDFIEFMDLAGVRAEGRNLSGLRTTFRDLCERMDPKDNDAIDLVMGHRRRHISKSYVEHFPESKLHAVTSFVFGQLFDGWSVPLSESPRRPGGPGAATARARGAAGSAGGATCAKRSPGPGRSRNAGSSRPASGRPQTRSRRSR